MQCLVVTHEKGARGLPPARPPLRRGATRRRSEWAAACWTRTRRCSTASCRRASCAAPATEPTRCGGRASWSSSFVRESMPYAFYGMAW
ncbi:hypothetical protein GW17_00011215 [Ensete ventricosum]|nr:hypothetical protein GW17_00011215 [Ensete ventricosum]